MRLLNYWILVVAFMSLLLPSGYSQVPKITSFSPVSGVAGTQVTIQGTNFGTDPAQVSVYFGPVRGTVQSVASTTITALVPPGAGSSLIRIHRDTMAAVSAYPFGIGFNGGNSDTLPRDAFANLLSLTPAGANPCVADFDNDGKPDYVVQTGTGTLSFYRNTFTGTDYSFSAAVSIAGAGKILSMVAADFNADQLPDLAYVVQNSTGIYVLPNTSTAGIISFGTAYVKSVSSDYPYSVDAADIDGNGKMDVVVGYNSSGTAFSVVRNIGVAGALLFSASANTSFGGNVGTGNLVKVADFDKDGKPDVVVVSGYFRPIFCYKNTSVPGSVSFSAALSLVSGRPNVITGERYDLQLGDMDGDQKTDLVFIHSDADTISVFRNTSTPGTLSFATKTNIKIELDANSLCVTDFDGDGLADIAFSKYYDSLRIVLNQSVSGSFSFSKEQSFYCGYPIQIIRAADFDLDGKQDILASGTDISTPTLHTLNLLRNLVNGPRIDSFETAVACNGDTVLIFGNRLTGATEVRFGGAPASSFEVIADTLIRAIVGAGASGAIRVVTPGGWVKKDGFIWSEPIPVIDSIVPIKAPVGSTVTIYGKHLGTGNDQLVRFGSGTSTVIAASDSTLQVLVPTGTSYDPVTVTSKNRGLVAYSVTPFLVQFPGGDTLFTNSDFADTVQYSLFSDGIKLTVADFNGDGIPDPVTGVYNNTNRFSVFRNSSDTNRILLNPRQDYKTYFGSFGASSGNVVGVCSGDLDGDGKPEMVTVSAYSDSLSVYPNTSTTDSISFSRKIDCSTGRNPTACAMADLDGDGKADLLSLNSSAGTVSVIKNKSTPGNFQFSVRTDYFSGSGPQDFVLADLTGDGLPEIIVANYNNNHFSVFKNQSTKGTIRFLPRKTIATATYPWFIRSGDADGDGKMDVFTGNLSSSKSISIFRNTGSSDSIQFAPRVDLSLPAAPGGFAVNDFDGDGLMDWIVPTSQFPGTLSCFHNKSTPGVIAASVRTDIAKITGPLYAGSADFTGDGIPDLFLNTSVDKLAIIANRTGAPVLGTMCRVTDTVTFFSPVTGTAYQWQMNDGNGFADLQNSTQFTGVTTRNLGLRNIPSSWYGRTFRCLTDGNAGQLYKIVFVRRWIGTAGTAWENPANWVCGQLPDEFTDVVIYGGNVIISSNVTVGSVVIRPGASLTVAPGFTLTTRH